MGTLVVTGATKAGIGQAVARALTASGHKVIGTTDTSDKTDALRGLPNLTLHDVDHATMSSVLGFCSSLRGIAIDGIVNCQMYFNMESQPKFSHEDWEKSLFVNMTMPNILVRELRAQFSSNASIVMITSTEAFIGSFGASSYASTKAAIHNLVKTWANILGPSGVRVNAIAPGWIGGVMDTDEVFNLSRQITPLRRLGAPEEIASVVEFLLGSSSSFISGSVITADGGYSCVDRIAQFEFEASNK